MTACIWFLLPGSYDYCSHLTGKETETKRNCITWCRLARRKLHNNRRNSNLSSLSGLIAFPPALSQNLPLLLIAITTILGGNGRGVPAFFDTLGLVLLSFPRLLIPNLILAVTHPCSLLSPIFQIGTSTLKKHLGIPNRWDVRNCPRFVRGDDKFGPKPPDLEQRLMNTNLSTLFLHHLADSTQVTQIPGLGLWWPWSQSRVKAWWLLASFSSPDKYG